MAQGNAADGDVQTIAMTAPAIAAEPDISMADAELRQHVVGTGDHDTGRAAAHIMHRGRHGDAKAVAAIPGPFPMARLLERGLTWGEAIPVARGCCAGEKNQSKNCFSISPHR